MERRQFLAAMAAPLGAQGPGRMRIAFLGGAHPHTPAKMELVRGSPRWELAGIAEEDRAAREQYGKTGVPLLGREQILGDASIRVVAVGSAVKDHAGDARQALEAGKHLHIEKPPATSIKDYRGLADLARHKGLLMQMGYMWRYNPAINAALEAARKGWLGEIHTVRGMVDIAADAETRRGLALFKGGVMFEMGCHLIDPTVRLLGRPASVKPVLRTDNTVAVLEYPRALAVIGSSALRPNAPRQRSFEILGANGSAVVRPIEPPALQLDLAKAAGPYAAGRNTVKMPLYRRYVDDFAELEQAVRLGKPLSVTPAEDLLVQETLLRACGM